MFKGQYNNCYTWNSHCASVNLRYRNSMKVNHNYDINKILKDCIHTCISIDVYLYIENSFEIW